jgi:hypothetical protein
MSSSRQPVKDSLSPSTLIRPVVLTAVTAAASRSPLDRVPAKASCPAPPVVVSPCVPSSVIVPVCGPPVSRRTTTSSGWLA